MNYRFIFAKTFFRLQCLKNQFSNNIVFLIEMTKNRRFQHIVFEFSKNNIVNIVSNKYNIFF